MKIKPKDLGYLAGALDYRAQIYWDPAILKLQIRFRTKDTALPEFLKHEFGGCTYLHRGTPTSEIHTIYEVSSGKAVDLLRRVKKLLVVQREKVEQILDHEMEP